jgi:hypothetical protein
MAQPLNPADFRGFNKSLTVLGVSHPVGPQVTTFQKPSGSGGYLVKQPGIVQGLDLRGRDLVIQADDVTVRNCLFTVAAWHTLNNDANKRGLVVELCEFDGEKKDVQHSDMILSGSADAKIRQNTFYNCPTDIINSNGGEVAYNALIGAGFQTGHHADGFTIHKSAGPLHIHHNYIDMRAQSDSKGNPNACVKIVAHFGNISNVTVEKNILIGGGYNAYCGPDESAGTTVDRVSFLDNLMGLTGYGDEVDNFIVGGGQSPQNGTNFTNRNNTKFSDAPQNVVSVQSSTGGGTPQPPGALRCTTPPLIEGNPVPGGEVRTASGIWENVPPDAKWSWRWLLGRDVVGTDYHTILPADRGGQLVVEVTCNSVMAPSEAVTVPGPDAGGGEDGGLTLTASEVDDVLAALDEIKAGVNTIEDIIGEEEAP